MSEHYVWRDGKRYILDDGDGEAREPWEYILDMQRLILEELRQGAKRFDEIEKKIALVRHMIEVDK